MVFNFLGDWISVTITRYTVIKIIEQKYNLLKYIFIDCFGIVLGYCITLSPTIFVTLHCLAAGDALNPWIHTGLLGNALIPFFLFIFATTNMPWVFSFFAFLAVFSVTVPSTIYLFLIISCFLLYKFHRYVWKGCGIIIPDEQLVRTNRALRVVNLLIKFLKIVIFVAIVAEIISKNLF
ncbi:MAG: hypothetical protein GY749_10150 [Desulfobacteraceae bacterium]|nr:hypothetical protein [Desulfobacteraceae bacterium]